MIDVSPLMLQAFRDEYIKLANALTDIGMKSITGGGTPHLAGGAAAALGNLASKAAPAANAAKKSGYMSSIFKGAEASSFIAALRQAQAMYMGKQADAGSMMGGAMNTAKKALGGMASRAPALPAAAVAQGAKQKAVGMAQAAAEHMRVPQRSYPTPFG